MNESIAISRTRASPRWRENTMIITRFGKPNIYLHESISMSWSSTLDKCKECSPVQLRKEHMKRNLNTLRHTRKRPLYADGRK
jgi:hypothetical protein